MGITVTITGNPFWGIIVLCSLVLFSLGAAFMIGLITATRLERRERRRQANLPATDADS